MTEHIPTRSSAVTLEPIDPATAQRLYLDYKDSEYAKKTVQGHRYRTNHFVRWCDQEGIENLNNLSGRDLHQYKLWRKEDGNLNKVSLTTQMSTIRVFLKWAASIDAVDPNLYTKVLVPQVSGKEEQRDELLEAKRANEILEHLSVYEYASLKHVLLAHLWETGMRMGAVMGLDVGDVNFDEKFLSVRHRPEPGTPLKNGEGGERLIAISPELANLLDDYISNVREPIVDDADREPLFTSRQGRLARSTMCRYMYIVTAPCYLDKECPGHQEIADAKCPEAVTPHAIRRGSITHHLSSDVPVQVVGDRMNVSRSALKYPR